MTRRRLDAEMVRRGLAASREEAQEAVRAGLVVVAGSAADKPSRLVEEAQSITVTAPVRRFASRGGEKLEAALDAFDVSVRGRDCLDAGASTGGFTDVLLSRGAARVLAVDVGYGQLAWRLREDLRVTVFDRTNIRDVHREDLPFIPSVVVADLSFIPLALVVGRLIDLAGADADLVLLVKPQFEAGRDAVGAGGVVRDPAHWRASIEAVASACADHGAGVRAAIVSPLPGPAGNIEFLIHARRGARAEPLDIDTLLDAAVRLSGAA